MKKMKLIKSSLALSAVGALATGVGVTTASCTRKPNQWILKSTLISNNLKIGSDNTAAIQLEEIGNNVTWTDPIVTGADDFNWVGDWTGDGTNRTRTLQLKDSRNAEKQYTLTFAVNNFESCTEIISVDSAEPIPAIKSIQASITTNTLQIGNGGSATLTVKGYNGANLDKLEVDFPSDEYDIQGFSGSGDIRTANITLKQNATPGEHSIKVEANDGSFDSQSVGLSVLDKTPIKSIQASITENTLQIGTDGSATLTVKGYNGVDLDNLDVDFSTDQYEISPFVGSGDTYKATIKLASEASPGEHFITVKAEGVDNQEVSLSVLDKAPTKSIQASITTNTLKMGYEGGIAILTVKGYNNADLDQLDVTSEDQNQFQIQHLTTSDDISAWQIMLDSGATSGSHSITVKAKDITFDEQTVDVTVLAAEPTPSIRSIQASITENTLQIGEENSQATLAVKGYNGAILDQLEIAPLESGQFTFTDFGPVGDTYQTTIKLGSGATKGSHSITVKAKDSTFDEQTVDVTVLAVAPTKSIQASITTNDLQIDKGGQAILTVKGYNGADLSLLEATSTEANQFSIQGFTQVGDTYQAIIMLGDNPTEGSHSITVKASDASFGEQDVNVTVLAIAPTKSIQASITANTLQIGDNSSEATLTVKGYNGANLANNLKAQGDTEQFVIESFELIDDVYQATIKLGSIPTEGNHLISVASIDGTSFVGQDVGVSILARAPIPALSATIDNSLKISDSRTAMITVTSYNGANLPSTKPTQDSTIFDFTDWDIKDNIATTQVSLNLSSTNSANAGQHRVTINNGTQNVTINIVVEEAEPIPFGANYAQWNEAKEFFDYSSDNKTISGLKDEAADINLNNYMFNNSKNGIDFGNYVLSIDSSAFASQHSCMAATGNVKYLRFSSISSVGSNAFEGCNGLKSVYLGKGDITDNKLDIGDKTFFGCSSLYYFGVASSTLFNSIGSQAFGGCSNLSRDLFQVSDINLDGLGTWVETGTGAWVMKNDKKGCLGSIAFGEIQIDGLDSIDDNAFTECASIKAVKAWSDTTSLSTIGSSAFENCKNLASIQFPEFITEVGGKAFAGCEKLTSISLPSTVAVIGNSAFEECGQLAELSFYLGSGTTATTLNIGASSFYNCRNLKYIQLGNMAGMSISNLTIGANAFDGCTKKGIIRGDGTYTTEDTYVYGFIDALPGVYNPTIEDTLWFFVTNDTTPQPSQS